MNRLNPLNDYIFKRLMEDTEHLIVLLNAILDAKEQKKLVSLKIINNKELNAEMIYDKASRLDVWAKTAYSGASGQQTGNIRTPCRMI
jgi:hypothetical protein